MAVDEQQSFFENLKRAQELLRLTAEAINELGDEVSSQAKIFLVGVVTNVAEATGLHNAGKALGERRFNFLQIPFDLLPDSGKFWKDLRSQAKEYHFCPIVISRVHGWESGRSWGFCLSSDTIVCTESSAQSSGLHHHTSLGEFYQKKKQDWLQQAGGNENRDRLSVGGIPKLKEILESDYPIDQLLFVYMFLRAQKGDEEAAWLIALAYDNVIQQEVERFCRQWRGQQFDDWIARGRAIAVAFVAGNTEAVVAVAGPSKRGELDHDARDRTLRVDAVRNDFAYFVNTSKKEFLKNFARRIEGDLKDGLVFAWTPEDEKKAEQDDNIHIRIHTTRMRVFGYANALRIALEPLEAVARHSDANRARFDWRKGKLKPSLRVHVRNGLLDLWRGKTHHFQRTGKESLADMQQGDESPLNNTPAMRRASEQNLGGFDVSEARIVVEQLARNAKLAKRESVIVDFMRRGILAPNELAVELGIKQEAAKKAQQRVLKKLRNEWEKEEREADAELRKRARKREANGK